MKKRPLNHGLWEDWYDGYDAFNAGIPMTAPPDKPKTKACPYPQGNPAREEWTKGWWAALEDSGKIKHIRKD